MMLSNVSRIIPFILYLALISLHQTLVGDLLSVWGADLALGSLLIMLVALYKSESVGVWFGAMVAFLVNTGDPPAAATGMVVAAGIAVGAVYFKNRLNLESMAARLAVVFSGCLILELLGAAFSTGDQLLFVWARYTIPSVIYTSLWALLFFLVKDGYLTRSRLARLF